MGVKVLIGGLAALGAYVLQPQGTQPTEELYLTQTYAVGSDTYDINAWDKYEEELTRLSKNQDLQQLLGKWDNGGVNHGIIYDMWYNNEKPDDVKRNGNECTSDENDKVVDAYFAAMKVVEKSQNNYDEEIFRKWFGKDNNKQADWMVKTRIQNTYDFMKEYKNWGIICCHNSRGSCDGCTGNTNAFIMGDGRSDTRRGVQKYMRVCQRVLDESIGKLGVTLFHEFMHLASVVSDHPTHAYKKRQQVELADEDPVGARLNADSYSSYVSETGMSREDFIANTGSAAHSADCYDQWSNCEEKSKHCCFDRRPWGDGKMLQHECCASCRYYQENEPKCSDNSNNCYDEYPNCNELANSDYACSPEHFGKMCCKSCKKFEKKPPAGQERDDGNDCADESSSCPNWVKANKCDASYQGIGRMDEYCCHSCNMKKDSEPQPKDDCKDNSKSCPGYSKMCDEVFNGRYIYQYCPKTCNKC